MHLLLRARRAMPVSSVLVFAALVAAGCGESSKAAKASVDSKRVIPASESFGVSASDNYSTYCGEGGQGEALATQAVEPATSAAPRAGSGSGGGSGIVQQPVVPGMGYNVLAGDYFNPGGVKKTPILDLRKLDDEGLLQESADNKTRTDATAGNSLTEYQRDYSASMNVSGGAGLFKGSASANFGTSSSFAENNAFVTYRANIRRRQYFLGQGDPDELRDSYLSASFKRSVDNPKTKPSTLFNTYGTHLLVQLGMGGRLDMNYRFDSTSHQQKSSLETAVSVDYGAVSASGSYKASSSSKANRDGTSVRVSSVGGTTDIAPTSDLSQVHGSYAAWVKSVNVADPSSLSFIGPPSEGAALEDWTIPIWALASSEQRQRDICVAFYEQLDANAASLAALQRASYVTDVFIGGASHHDDAQSALSAQFPVTATQRGIITSDTLNLTAYNGWYAYPGWAFGSDPKRAITDLYIGSEPTYVKNGVTYDVVKGGDGQPARMCGKAFFYTKDPRAAQAEGYKLTGIRAYNGGGGSGGDPWTSDTEWKLLTPIGVNNGPPGTCSYVAAWKKVYIQARFTKPRA